MRRLIVPGLALAAAIAVIAMLGFGVAAQGTDNSIDAQVAKGKHPPAPEQKRALPDLGSAGRRSLASLRGKVVVLNVFASWCDPCKAEAPILEQEQSYLAAHGGTVLGVTYQDDAGSAERFVRQWHITYPVVRDVDGSFMHAWGTTGVPETFVIDRRGHIAAVRRYQVDGGWLSRTVARVASQPA